MLNRDFKSTAHLTSALPRSQYVANQASGPAVPIERPNPGLGLFVSAPAAFRPRICWPRLLNLATTSALENASNTSATCTRLADSLPAPLTASSPRPEQTPRHEPPHNGHVHGHTSASRRFSSSTFDIFHLSIPSSPIILCRLRTFLLHPQPCQPPATHVSTPAHQEWKR